jgi:cobalt-zinc-cadmium efflux system membrane fusion protein
MMDRKGGRYRTAAAILVPALALSIGAGCQKAKSSNEEKPTAEVNPAEITVTPEIASQLKVGIPKPHEVAGSLEVAARIETDASRIARVGSPVPGRIIKLLALEGQYVPQGAVLAMLHSTDLSDTQFAFVKAYSQEKLAEQAAKRAEQLVAADVIGRAELEKRRAEQLQASTELSALQTQLRAMGMTDKALRQLETTRKLNADYPIVTSIAGTVLERKITIGQIVQPAEIAFMVADLSNVWVVADVPEEDSGRLRKGMRVEVKVPALPEQDIKGSLSYVSSIVDPSTRTVQVRMDLPNPRSIFKPAMLASMKFIDHGEVRTTLPNTAIVREENKDYVFVQVGHNKFMLREVALGAEIGEEHILESGLSPNEPIVLDGAFHLNNQRKQNAIKGGQ